MLIKITSLTISYFLLLCVNHSFKPAYASDCEAHLSRPGANRAKEMFRKKRALKKLKRTAELSKKKRTLEKLF